MYHLREGRSPPDNGRMMDNRRKNLPQTEVPPLVSALATAENDARSKAAVAAHHGSTDPAATPPAAPAARLPAEDPLQDQSLQVPLPKPRHPSARLEHPLPPSAVRGHPGGPSEGRIRPKVPPARLRRKQMSGAESATLSEASERQRRAITGENGSGDRWLVGRRVEVVGGG